MPLEVLELLLSNSRLYTVILENYPSLLLCRSSSDKQLQDSTGEICNKSGVTMSMRLICYAFATYTMRIVTMRVLTSSNFFLEPNFHIPFLQRTFVARDTCTHNILRSVAFNIYIFLYIP